MANRSYIYTAEKIPKIFDDTAAKLSDLGEWPWVTPFLFYLLISDNPRLCPSQISDGLTTDQDGQKTDLFAVAGEFKKGARRAKKFLRLLRAIAKDPTSDLFRAAVETEQVLKEKRNRYIVLETVELDAMSEADSPVYWYNVAHDVRNTAFRAGRAVDALSSWTWMGSWELRKAANARIGDLRFFREMPLRFDERFDHADTDVPIGLSGWSDYLFFHAEPAAD